MDTGRGAGRSAARAPRLSARGVAGCDTASTQPAYGTSECSANACVFMAFILLRLLVLGVIAAAADDDHITWLTPPRGAVPCVVAAAERLQWRRPPPPLEEDRPRAKPYRRRGEEELKRLTDGVEVTRKRNGTEGVYQCAVPHQKGVVLGYPQRWKFASMDKQFSRHPQNGTARAGQPYALSCEVASSPAATVSWLRDGQSLSHDDRYIFLNNQLLFTQIRKEDAGVYKCVATNTYLNKNRISDSAWLRVEDPVDEEPALLDIQGGVNITAARHSRVRLLCLVTGWPRPKITWEITDSTGRTATMEYTEEIVDLTSLELDLEGVYKCSVDGYTHVYKTFNVTMTEPVTITLPPVSKEVIRASTVRFNCTATGRPAPTVTWYKDGQPLVLGGRFNLRSANFGSRYELVIGGVTSADAGIYQCFASSLGSIASGWASLGVGGASAAAPSGVRCWPLAARVVLIRWERPMGDVMAYTVQTTLPAYPGQPHSNTEETITVSEPLTPYGFQVRAYIKGTGKNIASDMSEPPIVCQGQGVPVQISKKGEDSVLVSWKEFAQETPGVVQWMLQYRRDNSSQETNVTLPENVHSYTLPASAAAPLEVRVLGSRSEEWLPLNLTLLPWSPTAGRDDVG
ncbi:immunoglobulin superfamily DCC subclass member 3-like [Ostrinia nubilalis]|uniref:immunoglobulin superfamily DCC subclass member 3-like n=1 Tax=Ostrinia nubilalis TaxID=29057 RepID=UPI0030822A6A